MKKRKFLTAGLSVLLAAGMVVGCGSGSTTDAGNDNLAANGAGGGEKVTLKVALWDYSNLEYYKTMFAAFSEKYPNVTIEPIEFAADEYDNTLTTQLGGKQDFDVVFTKGTPALSALILQNHLLPLDQYMEADPDFSADDYQGLVSQLGLNGSTYAVPFRKDNNMVFYNKDLFDAAGAKYPQDGMTMAEYHELAAKMTGGTGNDKVYGAHVHTWPSNVNQFARRIEAFDYLDKETYTALKPYYDEILAMQDAGVIQDYGVLKSSNIHYSGVFYNQQAAMVQMGSWFINMLCENASDFNWGACSIPNDEGIGNTVGVGGVTPVSIGAYAKHPEEAWALINFICGEEGASILAENGIVPGFGSDAINQIFDELPGTYPTAPQNLSVYLDLDTYVIEQPMDPLTKVIDSIFKEEHSAIMTKSVTVDEGLQRIYDRVTEAEAK